MPRKKKDEALPATPAEEVEQPAVMPENGLSEPTEEEKQFGDQPIADEAISDPASETHVPEIVEDEGLDTEVPPAAEEAPAGDPPPNYAAKGEAPQGHESEGPDRQDALDAQNTELAPAGGLDPVAKGGLADKAEGEETETEGGLAPSGHVEDGTPVAESAPSAAPTSAPYISLVPDAVDSGTDDEAAVTMGGGADPVLVSELANEPDGSGADGTVDVEGGAVELPDSAPKEKSEPKPKRAKKTAAKKKEAPSAPKVDFFAADYRELDRDLSPRQKQEWEGIYASFRSKNLLYGRVVGSDPKTFDLKEAGGYVRKKMFCPVVVDYRVKVLIPSTEMWIPGEERPEYVVQEMKGANIAYVIISVDREGECAIASRRIALAAQRHYFSSLRGGHHEGELLKCNVLTVGPKLCLVECGGYDITLTQRDLSYTAIPDLRERYHPGDVLDCRLKEYAPKEDRLVISVKDVEPNPFIGADTRHPVGSRRNATISGKYKGGVFCTLDDDTVVLCLYSPMHSDLDFQNGDGAVIAISKFDYANQLVYGRILSKW